MLAILRWAPDDSPLAASLAGGRELLGWDQDRFLAKQTADTLGALAAGLGGSEFHEWVKVPKGDADGRAGR